MDYRRSASPPSARDFTQYDTRHSRGGSVSTSVSQYTQNGSPNSIRTNATATTTPPRSPPKIREFGPTLLPRVRPQDELVEPFSHHSVPSIHVHARTTSLPPQGYQLSYGAAPVSQNFRRSASPYSNGQLLTPHSATAFEHSAKDLASERRSSSGARMSSMLSAPPQSRHARSSSSTSIDPATLGRYGFPTYRQSPTPQPALSGSGLPAPRTASAMNHLAPIAMPNGQFPSYPARRVRTVSPSADRARPSAEAEYDPRLDLIQSSILEYLTAPNPTPSVVRRTAEPSRSLSKHFWFDIRNVRSWSDFNVDTITSMPGMLSLLEVKVPLRSLAQPIRVSTTPETQTHLAEICASHHAVKVNAGLRLALGHLHMAIRTLKPVAGGRQQPEFVSNLQCDVEHTIEGDRRGRVVGIVKCFDQWNSGLRNTDPNDKVKYLRGLAQLHYFMRQHGTRYGFIMTEIELVCVRASSSADPHVPVFGSLEVASSIRISTNGRRDDGRLQMTADLALWYLHMLAKEQPLPGQLYWKMDVGAPAALTRHLNLSRDPWISKLTGPSTVETREAKRARGWVWPGEPLARKETGNPRRRK